MRGIAEHKKLELPSHAERNSKTDLRRRHRSESPKTKLPTAARRLIPLIALPLLPGCLASDPAAGSAGATAGATGIQEEAAIAAALPGAKVRFFFNDFYGLTNPNPNTACAGDARAYYDAFARRTPTALPSYTPYTGSYGNTGDMPLPTSVLEPTSTMKPAFVRNVAVDLTDTNTAVAANQAFTCSMGTGTGIPPASSCATFDYGAIGGIPTNFGGSLLLFGGINGPNYSGVAPAAFQATYPFKGHTTSCGPQVSLGVATPLGPTSCPAQAFALAIETLPASVATDPPSTLAPGLTSATEAISSWANLGGTSDYQGPQGIAGGSAAYSSLLGRLAIFGGSSPMAGLAPAGAAADTNDTFTFDAKSQKWLKLASLPAVDAKITAFTDTDNSGDTFILNKSVGARALAGYAALPGVALSGYTTTGAMAAGKIDATDRIAIVGGLSSLGIMSDSYRFNPTFGPDLVDITDVGALNVPVNAASSDTETPIHWIDSSHTQALHNSFSRPSATLFSYGSVWNPRALFRPGVPFASAAAQSSGDLILNFGLVPLTNVSGATGLQRTGYLAALGGFERDVELNSPVASPVTGYPCNGADLNCGGPLIVSARQGGGALATSAAKEARTAHFSIAGNRVDALGTQYAPVDWYQFQEDAAQAAFNVDRNLPWFGGAAVLPGFDLSTNDVVYFGGLACKRYLNDSSQAPCTGAPYGTNPGRYYRFTNDPLNQIFTNRSLNHVAMAGIAPPTRAGMAAARGLDPAGNVIIVAWGGNTDAGQAAGNQLIYVLRNNAGVPTWYSTNPAGGTTPVVLANATLTFSHVTRRFYLFGGYSATSGLTSGDTWELTVGGGVACTGAGTCSFTWRRMSNGGGLTCYPSTCPPARRSHRSVEVNYNNANPGGIVTASGEPTCTAAGAPCSFGLFMEGGTPDGLTFFGDRWMLDPTANGGLGHWQKVADMPPRKLAAMASAEYYLPTQNKTAHRAILFGGETGLGSPLQGQAGEYYVAPTLGDTWMFDFDTGVWNKVRLLGRGYATGAPHATLTEFDARQAYNVLDAGNAIDPPTGAQDLAPPPLSGAILVTRALDGTTTPPTKLKIPEVYLLGGRTKDGLLLGLDHVYKFCAGTTGEKPAITNGGTLVSPRDTSTALGTGATDDASCDAFDSTANPLSSSPVADYVGRWIHKRPAAPTPSVTYTTFGSFMGAGAYDSVHDRIVLVGGLAGLAAGRAVTDNANLTPEITVLEYTPPSKAAVSAAAAARNGAWNERAVCPGYSAPSARYGHSLAYDPVNHQLILTGGYDDTGTLLTQTVEYSGGSYTTPEVWVAKRVDAETTTGLPPDNLAIAAADVPCYVWRQLTTFGNNPEILAQAGPTEGLAHATAVFIPSGGYNTGFYTTLDHECAGQGPVLSADPSISRQLAGGAYIDIDREALGAGENLLLNLTFMPLGQDNKRPDGRQLAQGEQAFFKVHLIRSGQSEDTAKSTLQPRYLTLTDTDRFPQVVQTLAVLAPPTGQARQEQILLPVSIDPRIDRIRVERVSGTAILIDATVLRMGYR